MPKTIVNSLLAALLLLAAGLMIGAMRQESATVDETCFLSAGYSYWIGNRYYLDPEHPPLAQMFAAFPLVLMDVRLPPQGMEIMNRRVYSQAAAPWNGMPLPAQTLFPHGPDFYYYPLFENRYLGESFVYGGQNNAERMLFWCRLPEVLLTLLAALVVFRWTRSLSGDIAGLLATAMFLLNPVVLAYGHIIQTDAVMMLAFPLAIWMFSRFIENGTRRNILLAGLATGLALLVKYTAIILAPSFLFLAGAFWLFTRMTNPRHRIQWRRWPQWLAVGAIAWGLILLIYFPTWSPAPALDPETAAKLKVPGWFSSARLLLIPPEYFKGLAIVLMHAGLGHEAYLMGQWSNEGWWYYFPLVFVLKTPVSFLLFGLLGLVLLIRRARKVTFPEWVPWLAALVYIGCAMTSKANLGVRHVMTLYPLLAVGAGALIYKWAVALNSRKNRFRHWFVLFPAWSLIAVLIAYPLFVPYFNELAGGPSNGYKWVVDSNFDWGQDAVRLKKFLVEQRGIDRIYLDYYGTQAAIDYYKIGNTRVNGNQARQIHQAYVVVSASQLVRPEWKWLRDSQHLAARIAYTMFIYYVP